MGRWELGVRVRNPSGRGMGELSNLLNLVHNLFGGTQKQHSNEVQFG